MNAQTPVCDFCSLPDVSWHYTTKDFGITTADYIFPDSPIVTIEDVPYVATEDIHPVRGVGHMAGTEWFTCDTCAHLIDAKDFDGLTHQVITTWIHNHSIPPESTADGLKDTLKQFYTAFFHQLAGPRQPYLDRSP